MSVTYEILDSPMPLTGYRATLALAPVTADDRTYASWEAAFDCAPERAEALERQVGEGVFAAALRHLDGLLARR